MLHLLYIRSEDLPSLQYTLWCIKEALRLYPPVPRIFRGLVEDIEIDGYVIPKGSIHGYTFQHY